MSILKPKERAALAELWDESPVKDHTVLPAAVAIFRDFFELRESDDGHTTEVGEIRTLLDAHRNGTSNEFIAAFDALIDTVNRRRVAQTTCTRG